MKHEQHQTDQLTIRAWRSELLIDEESAWETLRLLLVDAVRSQWNIKHSEAPSDIAHDILCRWMSRRELVKAWPEDCALIRWIRSAVRTTLIDVRRAATTRFHFVVNNDAKPQVSQDPLDCKLDIESLRDLLPRPYDCILDFHINGYKREEIVFKLQNLRKVSKPEALRLVKVTRQLTRMWFSGDSDVRDRIQRLRKKADGKTIYLSIPSGYIHGA